MPPDKTATAREILRRNITAVNHRDMNAYLANQHPESSRWCSSIFAHRGVVPRTRVP
jgi:hypothetical protein